MQKKWKSPIALLLSFALLFQSAFAAQAAEENGFIPDEGVTEEALADETVAEEILELSSEQVPEEALSDEAVSLAGDEADMKFSYSGQEAYLEKYNGSAANVTIPQTIERNGKTYTVTMILERAFDENENKENLRSINIPSTVVEIEKYAFDGCTNLRSISLPSGLKRLGESAFANCTSLRSVNIPANVTVDTSFYGPFGGCENLTSITFESGITKIPDFIFTGCPGIREIKNIPDTVTAIGLSAFDGCENLTSVDLSGTSITSIGSYAFSGCKKLSSVTFPEGLEEIKNSAFADCEKLNGVVLPAGLKNLEGFSFGRCESLTAINIPVQVKDTGDEYYGPFDSCEKLRDITFDEGIQTISSGLFRNCPGIISIVIPDSVTSIEDSAFDDCKNLSSITIPDSVTAIGEKAFRSCEKLRELFIPASVRTIGEDAFEGCATGFTIKCVPGSEAEKYAQESGYTYSDGRVFAEKAHIADADGIVLNKLSLPLGASKTLRAKLISSSGTVTETPTWSSSNTSIVTVTPDGEITGVAPGTTTINLITKNCMESLEVTVTFDFTYETESTKATITGYTGSGTAITIPGTITADGTTYTVTKIKKDAFKNKTALTDVTLPDSLLEIGARAFSGCTGLRGVTLPAGLRTLGENAFYKCTSLASVNIPAGVEATKYYDGNTYVGPFRECGALTTVTFDEGTTKIPDYILGGCTGIVTVNIPSSVTEVGKYAFCNCTSLTTVDMSQTKITTIGQDAFYGCGELTDVRFPTGLLTIGARAFAVCIGLSGVALPAGLKTLGENAFYKCTSLASVNIPAGVEATKYYDGNTYVGPFRDCGALTTVTFDEGTTKIPDYILGGCAGIATVNIPSSVTEVGKYAFCKCTNLETIDLSNTRVETIGESAFRSCSQMTSANINASTLKTINTNAFNGCSYLDSIFIPASVKTIGKDAFKDCRSGFRIKGIAGSAAEQYATDNGFTFTDGSVYAEAAAIQDSEGKALSELTLYVGSKKTLYAKLTPPAGEQFVTEIPTWTSSAEKVAKVDASGELTAVAAGTVTITLKTKNCTATLTVTVKEVAADTVVVKVAATQPEGAAEYLATDDGYDVYYQKDAKLQLETTAYMDGEAVNPGFTYKSTNTTAATVDANGLVTIKAPGRTTIEATAKDKGAKKDSIVLNVVSFEPALADPNITVYQAGDAVDSGLLDATGNRITAVEIKSGLSVTDGLKFEQVGGKWMISTKGTDTYAKKTTEKLVLTLRTEKGSYEKNLNVTVDVSKPSMKLKKISAAPLFYEDAKAVYSIVSNYEIASITADPAHTDGGFVLTEYDVAGESLTFTKTALGSETNRTAYILVEYKGFAGSYPMTVSVDVITKAATFKLDPVTVAKGAHIGYIIIRCGKEIVDTTDIEILSDADSPEVTVSKLDNGKLRLAYTGSGKGATYSVTLKDRTWKDPVRLTGKVTVVSAKSLTILPGAKNTYINKGTEINGVAMPIRIKGNCDIAQIDVTPEYDSSKLNVQYEDGTLTVETLSSTPVGKYKVKLNGKLGTESIKSGTVTVNVTDKAATVALKGKGSINLTTRSKTSILYTPSLKNIDAQLQRVALSGPDADKFTATVTADNKILLKATADQTLKTGVAYKPVVELTYQGSADPSKTTVLKKEVAVKMSNKLPNVRASKTKGTLYQNNAVWTISSRLTKSAAYEITGVELLADKKTAGVFSVTWDADTQSAVIDLTPEARENMSLKTGTYTVKYKVFFKDSDPSKYKTLSVKVTVR